MNDVKCRVDKLTRDELLQLIREIHVLHPDSKVFLDFAPLKQFDIFPALYLAIYLRDNSERVKVVNLNHRFADVIGFKRAIDEGTFLSAKYLPEYECEGARYIQMANVRFGDIKRQRDDNAWSGATFRGSVPDLATHLARKLVGPEEHVARGLRLCLQEVITNINQHAGIDNFFLCAQYRPNVPGGAFGNFPENVADFALIDRSDIGLLSITRNPRFESLRSHSSAIIACMERGNSEFDDPRRGIGLDVLRQCASLGRGWMTVAFGDCSVTYSNKNTVWNSIGKMGVSAVKGTAIGVRLDLDRIDE